MSNRIAVKDDRGLKRIVVIIGLGEAGGGRWATAVSFHSIVSFYLMAILSIKGLHHGVEHVLNAYCQLVAEFGDLYR